MSLLSAISPPSALRLCSPHVSSLVKTNSGLTRLSGGPQLYSSRDSTPLSGAGEAFSCGIVGDEATAPSPGCVLLSSHGTCASCCFAILCSSLLFSIVLKVGPKARSGVRNYSSSLEIHSLLASLFLPSFLTRDYGPPPLRSLSISLSTSPYSLSPPKTKDGVRVNPRINMFTTTGRMVTSDPPLQNLDHKIRVKRSWRTSLAEEIEAEVSGLEVRRM